MNGYQYLIARNRLMMKLEDELAKLKPLPQAERERETARLQAEFDGELAGLYEQVSDEYPGERKKKARPLDNPR
jgi:hypothetical protein